MFINKLLKKKMIFLTLFKLKRIFTEMLSYYITEQSSGIGGNSSGGNSP